VRKNKQTRAYLPVTGARLVGGRVDAEVLVTDADTGERAGEVVELILTSQICIEQYCKRNSPTNSEI
jgi:hypothetical protein